MTKRILIVAAHPDDELLGCGATASLHAERGDDIRALLLCEGETMRGQSGVQKQSATEKAARILGIRSTICIGLPDQHLDTLPIVEVITPIEKAILDFRPQTVFLHSSADLNRDHRIVFEAAMVALRPKNDFLEDIYSFYVVGSTEWYPSCCFSPDTWVGFGEATLRKKLDAFRCYETELCEYPHPRSLRALENLARMTGNQCCMEYAESFETVRQIKRGVPL